MALGPGCPIQSRLITNLDFRRIAREHFGIEGLEFVNQLWEAPTSDYVRRRRLHGPYRKGAADGRGGQPSQVGGEKQPTTAAGIDDFVSRCVDSFSALCEYAKGWNISVLIENHGGVSSNPDVVVKLMRESKLANLGTLPDVGNFPKEIDKCAAVTKLMPFAKGVSFKCRDFDARFNETTINMDPDDGNCGRGGVSRLGGHCVRRVAPDGVRGRASGQAVSGQMDGMR